MTSTAVAGLTPEQRELRKQGIGASEIAAVLGVDPYKTALDVYLEKTGQVAAFEGNEFTLWGNRLQAVIADEYAERMGVDVTPGQTVIHPQHPWALCTPDYLVGVVGATPGGPRTHGLECKNRNHFNQKAWGESGTDEVPLEVAAQCLWSMAITGLRKWDVAVLLGGNRLGIYHLDYDAGLAAAMLEQGLAFWRDYVLTRTTPPLDGSESSSRYLAGKWPIHGEGLKDATEEVAAMGEQLRIMRKLLKGTDSDKSALENLIKDFIGEQAGVRFPDGGKITWKRPKATTKVNWKMVADGLKSKVDDETYQTLVGIHTIEEPASRRFLCQFAEEA